MTSPSIANVRRASQEAKYLIPLIDIGSFLLILVPSILTSIATLGNSYDDAFITYRYAYNFASGNGFVYNVGEHFLGTTAPLYGLLLGILGIVNPDAIPLISAIISGIALGLTGMALYIYGRTHLHPFCGLLAGLFFVVNPIVHLSFGGEMLFQLALIMWGFVLYRLNRTLLAAVLLGVAVLTRADSLVAVGVIGIHYLVTQKRIPWRELLCLCAVIAPFIVLSYVYYGSVLPGTLGAKQAQRDSGFWSPFVVTAFEWIRGFTIQGSSKLFPDLQAFPHAIRFIYFIVIGIPAVAFLFRFWLLPLAWIACYVLAYHLLDVPFYHWYIIPIICGLMILAAAGVAGVVEAVVKVYQRLPRTQNTAWAAGALSLLSLLALAPGLRPFIPWPPRLSVQDLASIEQLYVDTATWLKANTPPDATVGYLEIGYLGYYSHRPIIDQLGLVNSGVAEHIARQEWTWSYQQYRPAYIIYNKRFDHLNMFRSEPWFAQEYREVTRLRVEGTDTLVIYARQPTFR